MTTYVYVPIMSAENLLVFAMDSDTGTLDLKHDVHLGYGGFPLCASRDQQTLYVGFRHNPGSFITSCRLDPATGGAGQPSTATHAGDGGTELHCAELCRGGRFRYLRSQ